MTGDENKTTMEDESCENHQETTTGLRSDGMDSIRDEKVIDDTTDNENCASSSKLGTKQDDGGDKDDGGAWADLEEHYIGKLADDLKDSFCKIREVVQVVDHEFARIRAKAGDSQDPAWMEMQRLLLRSKGAIHSHIRHGEAAVSLYAAAKGVDVEFDSAVASGREKMKSEPIFRENDWEMRILKKLETKLMEKRNECMKSGRSTSHLDNDMMKVQAEIRAITERREAEQGKTTKTQNITVTMTPAPPVKGKETIQTPIQTPISFSLAKVSSKMTSISPSTEDNKTYETPKVARNILKPTNTLKPKDVDYIVSKIAIGKTPVKSKTPVGTFQSPTEPDDLIDMISTVPSPAKRDQNVRLGNVQ